MAQDAELKLKVSLDLAFFRQQLIGLGQAAAGYKMPVQVQFDRRSIQNELNALGANIRRRNYRLTIETNLSAEIAKAETLARKLAGLGGKLKTGSGGFAASPQGAAGLMEYMQSQGLSGGGGFVGVGRSARLKNALEELTVKQLQGLAKSESITGVSRLKKSALVDKLMNDLSQQAMENILGNAQMALRRPVRGIFAPGRTIPQGPLGQFSMAAQQAQGPTLPSRPIFAAGTNVAAGAGQRYSFTGMGSMGQFPTAGMMGPSTPLTINARTSMFGGGGGQPPGGGLLSGMSGDFGRAIGNVKLPGANTIRELGSEFAFAAKQVLLFGTAYKALAFIQAFPGEVGQAVGQLQSFRNTLNAISPSAQEAAASNKLILDLVDKYNIPLQSARDGFTKLYASMAPAGFQGEEIRQLFTGISQAAATFGMSADKVDRVNYAFAQMASKGQVMSEELKGQLGDVLPGAMAIFAEAAGFKGPKAIQDFSAALEEGRYKGEAMVGLLKNVGIVMTQEFGPGAEGAARTFQGVINRMQNSLKLLYEAFEPVAVEFLNGVVTPMTQGIRQVADGVTSFFTGTQARTAGGSALAKELERLRPAFDGIRNNLSALIQQFSGFGKVALETSKILLQIAGNPVIGYLARIYAIVLPLNMALNVMRGLWISNAAQLLIFNARIITGTSTLAAFRGMMSATGATAQTTAAAIRGAGLTLRTFFASTGIGLVLVGISMLIERFMSLNQRLEETKTKALFAAQAIRGMSASEAKAEVLSRTRVLKTLQGLQQQKTPYGGAPGVTPGQVQQLETAGVPVEGGLVPGGRRFIRRENLGGLIQQQKQLLREALSRQQQLALEERQLKTPPPLPSIPGGDGDAGSTRKIKEYYRDISDSLSDIGQKEKDNLQSLHLAGQITERQYDLGLAAIDLETSKKIAAEQLRVALARLNDENLSAGDKVLKQKDLQIKYQNTLALAQNKYNLTVQKSVADLEKPIAEGVRDEALAIAKAETQIKAYRQGRLQLTAAEEAAIIVSEKFKDLDEEELGLMADKIKEYEEIIALRIENNRLLEQEGELTRAKSEIEAMGTGLMAGFYGSAAQVYESQLAQGKPEGHARQMAELETQSMRLQATFGGIQNAIGGISSAFGSLMTEGIASMVQGTATAQEVFSQFLNTIGQALMQAASQMIATYVAIGIARIFAGMGGGGGGYAQGNVSTDAFTGGGIPGLSNTASVSGSSFGGFTGGSFGVGKFANGGIVSGPTLGLIGEGKYNEAIVPLPDGRAIPVQMQGDSVRDKMNGSGNGGAAATPMLSMNFETTTINNVEYVSREQLEKAMMETRKLATRDGARQGANLAIDKIQQSPNTRRRIGI